MRCREMLCMIAFFSENAMLVKRRLTFSSLLKLTGAVIVCTVVVHIGVEIFGDEVHVPLVFRNNAAYNTRLPTKSRTGTQHKPRHLGPCKLYRFKGKSNSTRKGHFVAPKCKRVEPSPESCQIAEELFHSRPPETCEHQTVHEFCSLSRHGEGYRVHCDREQCDSQLSAATMDVKSGNIQWKNFKSASQLENWISRLLQPSENKKHFGFCYIACGRDEDEDNSYDGHVFRFEPWNDYPVGDDAFQLLILPPSRKAQVAQHGNKRQPVNINILFIDSVSHQHFFRSLPNSVKFLEELNLNKTSGTSFIDFELVQAVRSRTFETMQTLFEGEIDPSVKPFGTLEFPPKPLGVEYLLRKLKDKGYTTLWLEDLCYRWEWGLSKDLVVFNKSLSRYQTWRKFQQALSRACIDSVEVTYAMCEVLHDNGVPDPFHGPDVLCENGRHQHEYLLEYLTMYQDSMQSSGQPYFSILVSDVSHEGTGRRIQTLDSALVKYLAKAAVQENTLTILMSDHGNSYGDFLHDSVEGRFELFHPLLMMLVPRGVAAKLGDEAMDALHVNQFRLISVLDLHYMLQAMATDFRNKVSVRHADYMVTSRGLLAKISPKRTCSHIPRIMPNLCICENYDMHMDNSSDHSLFAHLAVGRLNNEIQKQFHRGIFPPGIVRGFGHCQHLRLREFRNVWKSFAKETVSLKMDLLLEPQQQLFFVSMQAKFGEGSSSVILEKVDRISPYSKFAVCADKSVKLQLCVCDTSAKGKKVLQTELPTKEDLNAKVTGFTSEVFVAENTNDCLYLIQRRSEHGGVFSVANICSDRVFHFLFELETTEMYVSDKLPIEDAVYPGQEIFLCMAIRKSPKAKWGWSFSMRHSGSVL